VFPELRKVTLMTPQCFSGLRTAMAGVFTLPLLWSCADGPGDLIGRSLHNPEHASAQECRFAMDFFQPSSDKSTVAPLAYGVRSLQSSEWGAKGPDTDTRADVAAKQADARLDTCPGLETQLGKLGLSFGDSPPREGSLWALSRIGFNRDQSQAIVFISYEMRGGGSGNWNWFKRAPGSDHWEWAGGGGGQEWRRVETGRSK
jgi:hypothetical protein